jgi:uncharacterized protein
MYLSFGRAAALVACLTCFHSECLAQSRVVISQVYGGGGNAGATITNDFVELFNRTGSAVSLSGWTLQYASATGSSWDRVALSGVLSPGQFYLVQLARGTGGTVSLPAPDAIGGIALSATSGKVALVRNGDLLTGSQPASTQVEDFVGYGTPNFSERIPAGELSNTTAAISMPIGGVTGG